MKILILSAFEEEQTYYHNNLDLKPNMQLGFVKVYSCILETTTLYFATTGMGTINAALTLATLAAQINPDYIFFSGTAGGIDPKLKIGDVIVATQAFDADIFSIHDNVKGTPFEPALINPNNGSLTPRFFTADSNLLKNMHQQSEDFSTQHGILATSNHFPSPESLFQQIKANNAIAIDMESAAIYQYAWLSETPSLIVRGISNLLDSDGHDNNVANSDVCASDRAATLIMNKCYRLATPNNKITNNLTTKAFT